MVDETNDGQCAKQGEDPLRKDLVLPSPWMSVIQVRLSKETYHKHEREQVPVKSRSFTSQTLKMKSLEYGRDGDLARPERLTRLDADFVQQTGETVSDALTGDQHKDGDATIHLVVTADT
jgi:hypothetical protein